MKKGFYILSLIAFLVVFAACEKCERPMQCKEDPFATDRSLTAKDDGLTISQKGGDEDETDLDAGTDGDITDPDEDEDFDGIVDPDEDEDFDKDGDGK